MFLILITVIISSTIFAFFMRYRQRLQPRKLIGSKDITGPKGLPWIGMGYDFMGDSIDTFRKIIYYCTNWNYRMRGYAGWHKFILVGVPKDLEEIMTDQRFLEKSDEYNMLRDWLQDGLLTVGNKNKWQKRRKLLTPAFHFSILEDFVQVMDQQATILINVLQKHVNGKPFDVFPYISLYTMDVICETSMGTELNAQTDVNQDYVRAVVEVSSLIHWRQHHFLARDNWYWNITANKKRHDELVKSIHEHTANIILSRRKEKSLNMNQSTEGRDSVEEIGIRKRRALLDLLLESTIDGKPLTNTDIQEESDNFMFAGHDTTTSAITFLLYNLAKHPDVQEKVYSEVVSILGADFSKPLTVTELNSFQYLDLVIKESLRMYTPVPIIGRYLREDVEINGHVYPANHNILLAIFMMHRNPELYPEPDKFKPERFLNFDSHEKKNAFSYIPFSAGYRNCIGQRFAQLELRSSISRILQHYIVELGDQNFEPILTAEVILKSHNGIYIKLKPRN